MKRCLIFFLMIVFSLIFLRSGEERIIQIGSPGGAGELVFPRIVKEGPDGRIYVYDQAESLIKNCSPQGKFVGQIGGKGQGPGEIQRAEGVNFGFTRAGHLFFTEFFGGHPWITVLKLDGRLIKVIKPQIKEFFGIAEAVEMGGNKFLVEFVFIGRPKREKDHFYHSSIHELILLDDQGKIVSRGHRTEHYNRISFLEGGG